LTKIKLEISGFALKVGFEHKVLKVALKLKSVVTFHLSLTMTYITVKIKPFKDF